jgi:hypothetical protein
VSRADDSLLASCMDNFRLPWKALALTDIVYKVVGFVVPTPLIGILFRLFLALGPRRELEAPDPVHAYKELLVVGAVAEW